MAGLESNGVDFNMLYLYLGSYAQDLGKDTLALQCYDKLKVENLGNMLRNKILVGVTNNSSFRLITEAYTCYPKKRQTA